LQQLTIEKFHQAVHFGMRSGPGTGESPDASIQPTAYANGGMVFVQADERPGPFSPEQTSPNPRERWRLRSHCATNVDDVGNAGLSTHDRLSRVGPKACRRFTTPMHLQLLEDVVDTANPNRSVSHGPEPAGTTKKPSLVPCPCASKSADHRHFQRLGTARTSRTRGSRRGRVSACGTRALTSTKRRPAP
jgi:hypothetical protein